MTRSEFENLIMQHKDKMYRFAVSILRNSEDSQDAVQEVVLKLWKNRQALDNTKNLESYCLNAIKNCCLDSLRKQKYRQDLQQTIRPNRTERNVLEQKDMIEKLKIEILNFPENQRMAIELKDFQGLEYEEVSEILGQNINAIRANVSRARKRLFEIFKEELKDA